ncbi:MBL fold metallo-hydrolase [Falsirhodobacter sp. alg1]|uniref:MBL fold metallo-hydrolase n=1 Tax=Falsirhodobacter sp. alg1 TaxID=1472418 RepID=UPI000693272E|nr:MBL fold metallo-hydrolase [Falsirhodobacter sp. alg1]
MTKTPPYGIVTHPEPGIRCILAPNPSSMTYLGTNTYIIGTGDVAVLDPGPDNPQHLAAILDALAPAERISHIILSHDHKDHLELAPRLAKATGAPIYGYASHLATYCPDISLSDGARLRGSTWELEAIHTPGHSDDHLCFAMNDICLTADHIMGWASSAIIPPRGRIADYLTSLDKLACRPWRRFLSAHGHPIETPSRRIATLRSHRLAREASIMRQLETCGQTLHDLTDALYRTLPPGLIRAATANVAAHLAHLREQGKIQEDNGGIFTPAGTNIIMKSAACPDYDKNIVNLEKNCARPLDSTENTG